MGKYEIKDHVGGMLCVSSPYNKDFSDGMKKLRARWNPDEKVWIFQKEKETDVTDLLHRCYGEEEKETGTMLDAVKRIISDKNALYSGDTIERLIAFAYFYGREQATKETSDAYRSMIKDMRKRAEKSRYTSLINEAIGEKNYLLFNDYTGRITKEIGSLDTGILGEKDV